MRPMCWIARWIGASFPRDRQSVDHGCAWNAVSAFANYGLAVAHVRGSYVPIAPLAINSLNHLAGKRKQHAHTALLPLSRGEP